MANQKVKITELPAGTPIDTDVIPYVDLTTGTTKKAPKSDLKGDIGDQGIQGIQGPIGPQGIQGVQGIQGIQGEKGDQGDTGSTGTGITFKGQVANVGDLPATATQGDAYLVQSDDSLHIYDGAVFVDGGSIQGPQGVQGNQGIQGEQGVQGIQGETGPAGQVQTVVGGTNITVDATDINNPIINHDAHTGDVTGTTALTIADNVIDEANLKLDTAPTDDYVLTADSSKSGGMKWAEASGGSGVNVIISVSATNNTNESLSSTDDLEIKATAKYSSNRLYIRTPTEYKQYSNTLFTTSGGTERFVGVAVYGGDVYVMTRHQSFVSGGYQDYLYRIEDVKSDLAGSTIVSIDGSTNSVLAKPTSNSSRSSICITNGTLYYLPYSASGFAGFKKSVISGTTLLVATAITPSGNTISFPTDGIGIDPSGNIILKKDYEYEMLNSTGVSQEYFQVYFNSNNQLVTYLETDSVNHYFYENIIDGSFTSTSLLVK